MATNYQEVLATPSSTGGENGGKVHRVYEAKPEKEEIRTLRKDGWKMVDFSTGHYAKTDLLKQCIDFRSSDCRVWCK